MSLENDICRKVYDHHDILRGEISTAIADVCNRAKVDQQVVAALVMQVNSALETSTNRMVTDFQRHLKSK